MLLQLFTQQVLVWRKDHNSHRLS